MEFFVATNEPVNGFVNEVIRDNDSVNLESGEAFFPLLGLKNGELYPDTEKQYSNDGRMVDVVNADGSKLRNPETNEVVQQQAYNELVKCLVFHKDDAGKWKLVMAEDPKDGKMKPILKRVYRTSMSRMAFQYEATVLNPVDAGIKLSAETLEKFNLDPAVLHTLQRVSVTGSAAELFKSFAHIKGGANAAFVAIARRCMGLDDSANMVEAYQKLQETLATKPEKATFANVVMYVRDEAKPFLTRNFNYRPNSDTHKLSVDYPRAWTFETVG